MIKNKKTGQMYIGQSRNIEKRFKQHCNVQPIDLAIANEGVENFSFNIIEEVDNVSLLLSQEKFWIDYYNTEENDEHYNRKLCDISKFSDMNIKYTLWNVSYCQYSKRDMFRNGRIPDLCKCFRLIINNKGVPIGCFHDFVTCEIISQLIEEAVNEIK